MDPVPDPLLFRKSAVHQEIRLKVKEGIYIWMITWYGAETWTLRKVDQKYLESFNVVLEKDGDQLG